LEDWFAKINTLDDDVVNGLLYGFPDSAIQAYMNRKLMGDKRTLDDLENQGLVQVFKSGGETYWAYTPIQDDIHARERIKQNFFDSLESYPEYDMLKNSENVRRSEEIYRNLRDKTMKS